MKYLICYLAILIAPIAKAQLYTASTTLSQRIHELAEVHQKVMSIFNKLTEEEQIAQMLVVAAGELGKPKDTIIHLLRQYKLGGVLLLNGTKEGFKQYVKEFNQIMADSNAIPLLYSADAEPSLINRKIKGTKPIKATSLISSEQECDSIATYIARELIEIGILHNYAPVCDLSTANIAIGNRSFGNNTQKVAQLSRSFIEASSREGILTTAKHFPGHGFVKGDSHKNLVYIDGPLKELDVYKQLIAQHLPSSIMVGHIAIRNNKQYNTANVPATCSRKIVTDLLKNELGFQGLIVTDAMTMLATAQVKNAPLEAVKAGCDLILMAADEKKFIKDVKAAIATDPALKEQVQASIKKILSYKVALGLL